MAEKGPVEPRTLTIRGALSNLKPDDASRLAVYLVRGDETIARASADQKGMFQMEADRASLEERTNFPLEAVVGAAGHGGALR